MTKIDLASRKIGEGVAKKLKEIKYFRLTERGLENYEMFCHFDRNQIKSGSVVIDVGSGWNQELSKEIDGLNMGITTISVDPTLAIPSGGIEGVVYEAFVGDDLIKVEGAAHDKRMQIARENSVAAVVPELPLKSGAADLVVDCFGPATYLEDDYFGEYVNEIVRIMAKGGEAHLFPVDYCIDFVLSEKSDGSLASGERRLNKINNQGLEVTPYIQEDGFGNVRPGVILKKT